MGRRDPYVFTIEGEQQQISFGQANPTGGKSIKLTDNHDVETFFDLKIDCKLLLLMIKVV